MARIAGVDLPRNKQARIALTYIFGIGNPRALRHPAERPTSTRSRRSRISARTRSTASVSVIEQEGKSKATSARTSRMQHQAPDRNPVLSWPPPSPQLAVARPAHPHQRPHPQGSAQGHGRRQEESDRRPNGKDTAEGLPARPARTRSSRSANARTCPMVWFTFRPHSTTPSSPSPTDRATRLSWKSSGSLGFRGSRKGTPFAAQQAAVNAANQARDHGLRSVDVRVSGPGSGRESAVRALAAAGIEVRSHPRRHADSAQRLPSAEAPQRLSFAVSAALPAFRQAALKDITRTGTKGSQPVNRSTPEVRRINWHVIPDQSAAFAVAKARSSF